MGDSDLLLTSTWLMKLKGWMVKTDGIMTLYRSEKFAHPEISCDKKFCYKASVGSAGTVWCRNLLESVLSQLPKEDIGFDYQFSTLLIENNFNIPVPIESPALHFGLYSISVKNVLKKVTDIGGVKFNWN